MSKRYDYWLRLNAPNDVNGNPRAAYVHYIDEYPALYVSEGYIGIDAARRAGCPPDSFPPTIYVTPGELRRLRNIAREYRDE